MRVQPSKLRRITNDPTAKSAPGSGQKKTMTQSPLRILIAALGSYGDMHPFLAIAQTLRARGHHVIFIAPAMYANLAAPLKIDFVPIGTVAQFDRFAANPDLWHPLKSFAALAEGV